MRELGAGKACKSTPQEMCRHIVLLDFILYIQELVWQRSIIQKSVFSNEYLRWRVCFHSEGSTYAYSDTIVSLPMASVQKAFLVEELLKSFRILKIFLKFGIYFSKNKCEWFFFSFGSSPDVCWPPVVDNLSKKTCSSALPI